MEYIKRKRILWDSKRALLRSFSFRNFSSSRLRLSILQNGKKRTILICLNATVPALQNDNKCVPKIQFTVHHAETKRRCHKVSASDVFRCAESPARAGAPKLRQQFLVFGMFLFGAPKNSKLAIRGCSQSTWKMGGGGEGGSANIPQLSTTGVGGASEFPRGASILVFRHFSMFRFCAPAFPVF